MIHELQEAPESLIDRLKSFPVRLASATLALTVFQILKSVEMRVAYYDSGADPARAEYNEHCIYAFWHENLGILLPQWRRCPIAILTSQHRDATWLKYVAGYYGFNVVRGSSTRGGAEAIRKLNRIKSKTSFAITPDGPRGPRQEMSLGTLFLASRLRMPLVLVGVGFDQPYRFNTWDKFAMPLPFSRARVVFGPKIQLDRKLGRDELEETRRSAGTLLAHLDQFATDWAVSGAQLADEIPFARARRCNKLEFESPVNDSSSVFQSQRKPLAEHYAA